MEKSPYEPTQPANSSNMYLYPYDSLPDIPPPPPKPKKHGKLIVTILVVMLLLIVASVTGTYLYVKSSMKQNTNTNPSLAVVTPIPTVTIVTPTAPVYPYGARAILQDFIDAGLSVGQPVDDPLTQYPHKAERGAYKWEMYGSEMSLSVYATTQDAQDNGYYAETNSGYQPASYNTNVSYIYYGPCLLIYSPTHVGPGDIVNYRNVMQRNCT